MVSGIPKMLCRIRSNNELVTTASTRTKYTFRSPGRLPHNAITCRIKAASTQRLVIILSGAIYYNSKKNTVIEYESKRKRGEKEKMQKGG